MVLMPATAYIQKGILLPKTIRYKLEMLKSTMATHAGIAMGSFLRLLRTIHPTEAAKSGATTK